MLDSIKAVIFDLDGTIIDSMWIWEKLDREFLQKRGIDVPNDLNKDIEGMSFTETVVYFKNRFKLNEDVEDIKSEFIKMAYDYYKNKIELKEGVREFIEFLKSKNIKLGIGTSNLKELVVEVLKRHDIIDYFDTIRTSCEVKRGKPFPDIFLKVAQDLKVEPKDCLVFEDTYAGVLAAKRAGMKVIAVSDELSLPNKEEICQIADKYVENYLDIA
ncbi:haloacid dehalogenase superfamily, subfamily IA, variant 3 with third motif having DD or ED/haloacid dehalogenase superfamily, subfamily IA, variant 1 with third motif having Dx(3-4)D or Dx(3-4)E [Caminicella sporogenes DSM 14501]|uniref:Haloacid dehalogenase superfamily, subfamily IA, variant 3 with third motif having DD or ED/haloacid dehalogenase superfamily, subfamily IA, variant 1 with third motif having Dx(3-4)D or Dx(3-4)E n=1 Tax=Caminicella sporogenes DSM 14501 TaxID=1121266 RepID=A0A1M6N3H3_9FIRM|nr:HAD family phosphatase [Caminicella sporogenes]RKD22378.1 HAD family hydrolase [Caminicella sporogenes]SHJ90259.1 haloacid dehalogenase superfamily, subfamily IA, variant 3 with third motif having DD or ED/haloacid dehalogenase superfamily, subfamily IA, variant 1 with third motif having Dx(3-4)D or Dx(3-4)E [Caminicella sporogenes DSM 14501]